jgi:hypothetical protein
MPTRFYFLHRTEDQQICALIRTSICIYVLCSICRLLFCSSYISAEINRSQLQGVEISVAKFAPKVVTKEVQDSCLPSFQDPNTFEAIEHVPSKMFCWLRASLQHQPGCVQHVEGEHYPAKQTSLASLVSYKLNSLDRTQDLTQERPREEHSRHSPGHLHT